MTEWCQLKVNKKQNSDKVGNINPGSTISVSKISTCVCVCVEGALISVVH